MKRLLNKLRNHFGTTASHSSPDVVTPGHMYYLCQQLAAVLEETQDEDFWTCAKVSTSDLGVITQDLFMAKQWWQKLVKAPRRGFTQQQWREIRDLTRRLLRFFSDLEQASPTARRSGAEQLTYDQMSEHVSARLQEEYDLSRAEGRPDFALHALLNSGDDKAMIREYERRTSQRKIEAFLSIPEEDFPDAQRWLFFEAMLEVRAPSEEYTEQEIASLASAGSALLYFCHLPESVERTCAVQAMVCCIGSLLYLPPDCRPCRSF